MHTKGQLMTKKCRRMGDRDLIVAIRERAKELTAWEREFLDSVAALLMMSPKQRRTAETIYKERVPS